MSWVFDYRYQISITIEWVLSYILHKHFVGYHYIPVALSEEVETGPEVLDPEVPDPEVAEEEVPDADPEDVADPDPPAGTISASKLIGR